MRSGERKAADHAYTDADGLTGLEGVTWVTDDNGNVTGRGSDTFAWDHENRLVESVVESVTTTYAYNGAGIRVRDDMEWRQQLYHLLGLKLLAH